MADDRPVFPPAPRKSGNPEAIELSKALAFKADQTALDQLAATLRPPKPLDEIRYPENPSPSAWLGRRIWAFIQRLRGG